MKEIIVKNQEEYDALSQSFSEQTRIIIDCGENWIKHSVAWENSHVEARENSHVEARENSHVEAWGNSHVEARENSHVEARGNSHVVARENSHVEAWENSHVEAWGNSHVVARENSHVEARENSHVEAWGNSHVEARENSHVEAWGNSHVEAWGNSHVVAWENVGVLLYSDYSTVLLFMFAVCWKLAKGKVEKKAKTATIIIPKHLGWFVSNAIVKNKTIILYKKISKDFKTQEGLKSETLWTIGSVVEHKNWKPKEDECGDGKFHACSRPYFCDEFRSEAGDRYIALEVAVKDTYEWKNPQYPHKIAFRKGKVLYECDWYGNKL